jgi:hypothetical protein
MMMLEKIENLEQLAERILGSTPEEVRMLLDTVDAKLVESLRIQSIFAELTQTAWTLATPEEQRGLFFSFGVTLAALEDHACETDGCSMLLALRAITIRVPGLLERAAAKIGSDAQLAVEGKNEELRNAAITKGNFAINLVAKLRDHE